MNLIARPAFTSVIIDQVNTFATMKTAVNLTILDVLQNNKKCNMKMLLHICLFMLGWLILYLVAINSFKASSFTITHIVSNSVLTSSMLTWVRLTFINVDFTWFSFQTRLALALIIIDWKSIFNQCDLMEIYHLLMTHLCHSSYFPLLGMEMIYNHQCLFHKTCHCSQWNICREILLLQSWRRSHYGKDSFRSHTNWTLFHNWFPAMFT